MEKYKDRIVNRNIDGLIDSLFLELTDEIISDKKCNPKLALHCAEHIKPEIIADGILLTSSLSENKIFIALQNNHEVKILQGTKNPSFSGWLGVGFSEANLTYTIECTIPINQPFSWKIYKLRESE